MEGTKDDETPIDEEVLPHRVTSKLIEIEKTKIDNMRFYQKLKDTNFIWHQNTTYYRGFGYLGQSPILSNPWLPSKAPGKVDKKSSEEYKDGESIDEIDNIIPYHSLAHSHGVEGNDNRDEKAESNSTESKHK